MPETLIVQSPRATYTYTGGETRSGPATVPSRAEQTTFKSCLKRISETDCNYTTNHADDNVIEHINDDTDYNNYDVYHCNYYYNDDNDHTQNYYNIVVGGRKTSRSKFAWGENRPRAISGGRKHF